MGYTHYFGANQDLDTETFARIGDDVRTLINSGDSRIPALAYESDEPNTPPQIDTELIRFNGIDDDGHETFYLPVTADGFNFCKTAEKPYDIVVCATLLIINQYKASWLNIGSDGEREDWQPAVDLVSDVLGYYPEFPDHV